MTSLDALNDTTLVVWSSAWITPLKDTVALLYGQLMSQGELMGGPFQISSVNARPRQFVGNSLLVVACGKGFVVFWNDYRNGSTGVYSRTVSTLAKVGSEERKVFDTTGHVWIERYGNPDSGRVIRYSKGLIAVNRDGKIVQGPMLLEGEVYASRYFIEADTSLMLFVKGGYSHKIHVNASRISETPIPKGRISGVYGRLPNYGITVIDKGIYYEFDSIESQTPRRSVPIPRLLTMPKELTYSVSAIAHLNDGSSLVLFSEMSKWPPSTGGGSDATFSMAVRTAQILPDDSVIDHVYYSSGMTLFRYWDYELIRELKATVYCNELYRIEWIMGARKSGTSESTIKARGVYYVENGHFDSTFSGITPQCSVYQKPVGTSVVQRFDSASVVRVSLPSQTPFFLTLPNDTRRLFDTNLVRVERTRVNLYDRFGHLIPLTTTLGDPVAEPYRYGGIGLGGVGFSRRDIPDYNDGSLVNRTYLGPLSSENYDGTTTIYQQFILNESEVCKGDLYHTVLSPSTEFDDVLYSCRSYTVLDTRGGSRAWINDAFDNMSGGWSYSGFSHGQKDLVTPVTAQYEPNSGAVLLQYNYRGKGYRTAIFGTENPTAQFFVGENNASCCPSIVPLDSSTYLGLSSNNTVVRIDSDTMIPLGQISSAPFAPTYIRLLGSNILRYGAKDDRTFGLQLLNSELKVIRTRLISFDGSYAYRFIQHTIDSTLGLYVMEPDGIHATFFDNQLQILISDTLLLDIPGLLDFDVVNQGDTLVLAWTKVEGGYPDAFWTRFRLPTIGRSSVGTGSTGVERERTEDQIRVTDDLPGYAIRQQENVLLQVECVDPDACGDVRGLYDARGVMIAAPVLRWGTRTTVVDLTDVRSGAYYLVIEVGDRIVIRPVSVVR